MAKPDPDDWPQTKLSKAQADTIRPTSESARQPRRKMLDEGDDEILDSFDRDFSRLFDNPEKL